MSSRVLHITGLTRNDCASHVEKALLAVPGVHQAEVAYPEALARVSGEPAPDPAMLFSAVQAAGYGDGGSGVYSLREPPNTRKRTSRWMSTTDHLVNGRCKHDEHDEQRGGRLDDGRHVAVIDFVLDIDYRRRGADRPLADGA